MEQLFRTIRILLEIIQEKDISKNQIKYFREIYLGLDQVKVPVNIFKPRRSNNHTIAIFPGASPMAEEHPQMIWLANIMRNAGYQVFLPQIQPLKEIIISPNIPDLIGCFYQWLCARKDVCNEKIIVIGISFSGAFLLKASLGKNFLLCPPKSILVYGTYYDVETAMKYLITGKLVVEGIEKEVQVDDWGLIGLFHNYLSKVDVGYDTTKMQKILSLKIKEKNEEIEVILGKTMEREKKLIEQVLLGSVDKEIERIIELIWEKCRNEFEIISPRYWCDRISQKVFIMHGANDTMVPYTESLQLAERLKDNRLLISHLYEHHNIKTTKGILFKLKELIKIFTFLHQFICQTERK